MAGIITKIKAEILIRRASRLVPFHMVSLNNLMRDDRYLGLIDTLISSPVPESINIKGMDYHIPKDLNDLSENISYGQRIFMSEGESNDIGLILRVLSGYLYTGKWNESKALDLIPEIMLHPAVETYPAANHIISLMGELSRRESKLLHREPSQDEKSAGIDKLSKYSQLSAILFLQDSFKCTETEVLQKPYNDCLVRFMLEKERAQFQERYSELMIKKLK